MKDFSVTWTVKLIFILLCTITKTIKCTGLGRCPIFPQLPNFDIRKMSGRWYEVERSFHLMEISASCTELDVALNERDYLLITVNTVNRWYKLNNRMPYIIGRMLPGAGVYNILYTDYSLFAIVWSCANFSIAHSDNLWVLGRQRDVEVDVRARIYGILQQFNMDPDRLILSKNSNCTGVSD